MVRRPSRPPGGYVFSDPVGNDGLSLTWTPAEPGASTRVIDLSAWPGAESLKRELISALAPKVAMGGGTWRSTASVNRALLECRKLVDWCGLAGIETLAEFSHEHWTQFSEHLRTRHKKSVVIGAKAYIRALIRAVPGVPTRTLWALNERIGSPRSGDAQQSYSRADFKRMRKATQNVVYRAHRRITRNYELVLRRDDPTLEPGLKARADALHFIFSSDGRLQATDPRIKVLGPLHFRTGRPSFIHFLTFTPEEGLAAAALLTCLAGYNASTLERLDLADRRAGEGETSGNAFTLENDKPRRGERRHFSGIHIDEGKGTVGRAYRWIEEATQPARDHLALHGRSTDRLLLYGTRGGGQPSQGDGKRLSTSIMSGLNDSGTAKKPGPRLTAYWLPDGLALNFQMLHRSFQTVMRRGATHNEQATHVRDYVMASDEVRKQMQQRAADGIAAALEAARRTVTLRLTAERDATPEINSGAKDTGTAACKDIRHHPITGEVCTDSFLMCLSCENAVATPRHLPRLCLLHQALTDLKSTLTTAAWTQWAEGYLLLTAFLTDVVRLTDDRRRSELARASKQDREHVRLLLGGEFDHAA